MENTFEVATANGHKAILKSFFTVAERRQFNNLIDVIKDEGTAEEEKTEVGARKKLNAITDKSVEFIVLSIDGDDKVLNKYLLLPNEDGNEIVKNINRILSGEKKEPATPRT